jgi:hypothetical protein
LTCLIHRDLLLRRDTVLTTRQISTHSSRHCRRPTGNLAHAARVPPPRFAVSCARLTTACPSRFGEGLEATDHKPPFVLFAALDLLLLLTLSEFRRSLPLHRLPYVILRCRRPISPRIHADPRTQISLFSHLRDFTARICLALQFLRATSFTSVLFLTPLRLALSTVAIRQIAQFITSHHGVSDHCCSPAPRATFHL